MTGLAKSGGVKPKKEITMLNYNTLEWSFGGEIEPGTFHVNG